MTEEFDVGASLIVRTMCDPLIDFDPTTGEARPALAESWTVDSEGAAITVKIRKGLRFADGSELTATTVIDSLSRAASLDLLSPTAHLLEDITGYATVHGDEETDDEQEISVLSGVKYLSKYAVSIGLTDPRGDFYRVLGHPLAIPLSAATIKAGDMTASPEPQCIGPYRLASRWEETQESIVLMRVRDYYAKNTAYVLGGAGYVDRIEFRVQSPGEDPVATFRSGAVQIVSLRGTAIPAARATGGAFVAAPISALDYIGLPSTEQLFRNRDVRIALSQALDREAIANATPGGPRTPASSFLPPTLGAMSRPEACARQAPRTGDVAAARKSAEAAGVDLRDRTVKLFFNDEFENRHLVEQVARDWDAALGLKAELVPMGWEAYIEQAVGGRGLEGAFRMTYATQVPSPDSLLAPLFSTAGIGEHNVVRFSSATFDRLLTREARTATTDRDRQDRYQELEDLICQQMPVIPVGFRDRAALVDRERLIPARGRWLATTTALPVLREMHLP